MRAGGQLELLRRLRTSTVNTLSPKRRLQARQARRAQFRRQLFDDGGDGGGVGDGRLDGGAEPDLIMTNMCITTKLFRMSLIRGASAAS